MMATVYKDTFYIFVAPLHNNVARCFISLGLIVQFQGMKNKVHKFESLKYQIYTKTSTCIQL